MLQVIVLSILFGFAILKTGSQSKTLIKVFDELSDLILSLVTFFMSFAPYGVFMLISKVFAQSGLDAFGLNVLLCSCSSWPYLPLLLCLPSYD